MHSWEIGLKPWDTAAGTLLIQEAGGRVGTLTGGAYAQGGNLIAGSPKAYEALVELLPRRTSLSDYASSLVSVDNDRRSSLPLRGL